jgi:lysophospholipase L1-like esterase
MKSFFFLFILLWVTVQITAQTLLPTQSPSIRGTMLLYADPAVETRNGFNTISTLHALGFDVLLMQEPAFTWPTLRNKRISIMGLGKGGKLAAESVQFMKGKEQPENLILVSPKGLDSVLPGTVYPAIMPPLQPTARLFCAYFPDDDKTSIINGAEYAKKWIGFSGYGVFHMEENWTVQLSAFLGKHPIQEKGGNTAAIPVAGYSADRHARKIALVRKNKYDLILLGNSITNNFEKPEYQDIWNQYYSPRNALNLGYSGYRTENLLWNIQHGELDGQQPKVLVLEIGTNNIDEKNYPVRHTAEELAGGIKAIVSTVRKKSPATKIIILRCFPGNYGGPNPTSHRAILERASDLVSVLADGKHIFYCDVNHVFLNFNGSINKEMMPDWLHPSVAGARAWARAMEPLLSELMGDVSRDTVKPTNTAIIPRLKLEEDSYNWYNRHADVLRLKDSVDPQIILIGNSITHFWGGLPALRNLDGSVRQPNGPKAWASAFGKSRVLNLGFGWDRTQNVLWRLDHGEVDGLHPQKVIINIGTNNTSETPNARMNTAPEIVEGIRAICLRIRSKLPGAEIILMAVLPREEKPGHPRRQLINAINSQLADFAAANQLVFVDIGPKMLTADGTLTKDMAPDFCHPTEKGYQVWADAIRPLLRVY